MIVNAELRHRIADFHAAYAACLDHGRLDDWPDFFTEDASYRITARENFDRDLPLSTLSLRGHGMMRDRLYGVQSTIFHAPYYQRHILGPSLITALSDDTVACETNYLVVRTKRDMPAELFNVGVYRDVIRVSETDLKFTQRVCVFDNDLIPNSIIYPI